MLLINENTSKWLDFLRQRALEVGFTIKSLLSIQTLKEAFAERLPHEIEKIKKLRKSVTLSYKKT